MEICHVIDINAPPKEKSKTPGTRKRKMAVSIQRLDLGDDDDDDDRHGYDGGAPVSRDHYTPSIVRGSSSAPRKRRRKTLAKDELPTCFSGDLDDDSRLDPLNISYPALSATGRRTSGL